MIGGNLKGSLILVVVLADLQNFPYDQRFGKNVIDGIEGFEEFIRKKTEFKIEKKIISFKDVGKVLLATLERRE